MKTIKNAVGRYLQESKEIPDFLDGAGKQELLDQSAIRRHDYCSF